VVGADGFSDGEGLAFCCVFNGGTTNLLPDVPPDMLGARLTAWLGGRVEGALQLSLSDGVGELAAEAVVEDGVPRTPLTMLDGKCERSAVSLTVIEEFVWVNVWRAES